MSPRNRQVARKTREPSQDDSRCRAARPFVSLPGFRISSPARRGGAAALPDADAAAAVVALPRLSLLVLPRRLVCLLQASSSIFVLRTTLPHRRTSRRLAGRSQDPLTLLARAPPPSPPLPSHPVALPLSLPPLCTASRRRECAQLCSAHRTKRISSLPVYVPPVHYTIPRIIGIPCGMKPHFGQHSSSLLYSKLKDVRPIFRVSISSVFHCNRLISQSSVLGVVFRLKSRLRTL